MPKTVIACLGAAVVLAAGCGSDDSHPDAAKPAHAAPAAKTSPGTAGVPTYAQVKAIALKDPKVARLCPDGKGEDHDVGLPPRGETYTRLLCGQHEILDYVAGKGVYADNYKSAVELSPSPVWSHGPAYVKPGLVGPRSLARQVRAACACGKVVEGGYGR